MTRTLITGASGFTGRYLTSLLAAKGHQVHGVVHFSQDGSVPDATATHVADLANYQEIANIVETVRPNYVVHLAGIAFVGHDDLDEMYRANVVGTRQLLQALSRLESKPSSIILASSANVYGNRREGVLDESMVPAPANDYGVSKVASEYVSRLYDASLPLITVRPFNYTGRGQSSDFLIPKIVAHARSRAPVIALGNLDIERDFSDVRTVVDVYARLLTAPRAVGQTLNICSGRAISLRKILAAISQISGHKLNVEVSPALVRTNEVRSLSGSPARLESVIGQIDAIPIEETLRWMLDA